MVSPNKEEAMNKTLIQKFAERYAQVQAQIFVSGADKGFLSLKWRNDWLDWEVMPSSAKSSRLQGRSGNAS